MTLLLTFFFGTLLISFVCSLMESTILSVSYSYTGVLVKQGKRSGSILRNMKRKINPPLSAILTFNTVANTVGAAAVGAQAYKVFGSQGTAVVSGIFTLMILTFSEIPPKTLGAVYWKKIAPAAAYIITGMIILAYPVVRFLEAISLVISRKGTRVSVSREEIIVLAETAVHDGVLQKKEAQIIENVLLLHEIRTGDILTPRSVISALQKDQTVAEAMESQPPIHFTRIPVYNRGLDDVIGLVLHDHLMEAYYTGKRDAKIETLMMPIHAVPESKPIADLLDEFIARREHLFEVVDEYGGTAGIVTLEDVLETLLGVEIVDEFDSVEDMRAYAVEKWKKRRKDRNF